MSNVDAAPRIDASVDTPPVSAPDVRDETTSSDGEYLEDAHGDTVDAPPTPADDALVDGMAPDRDDAPVAPDVADAPADVPEERADAADGEVADAPFRDARRDAAEPKHRPTAAPCPAGRGSGASFPSEASAPFGSSCHTDANCMAGVNGRCLWTPTHPNPFVYHCSYDECGTDAGCGVGVACICRAWAEATVANYCAPSGNCLTDADCGAAGYCSLSFDKVCPVPLNWGYFCHTPNDECMTDADCDESPNCTFNVAAGRWTCSQSQACPDASF
jgi:hypothetical protein